MRVEAAANRGRPVSSGGWARGPDRFGTSSICGPREISSPSSHGTEYASFSFSVGCGSCAGNLRSGRGDRRACDAPGGRGLSVRARSLGLWSAPRPLELRVRDDLRERAVERLLFGGFIWVHLPRRRALCASQLAAHADLLDAVARRRHSGIRSSAGTCSSAPRAPRSTETVRNLFAVLWPGSASPAPRPPFYAASARDAMAFAVSLPVSSLVFVLGIVFFLAFARRWLRLEWLAAIVVTALFSTNFLGFDPAYLASGVVSVALLVFIATRFGSAGGTRHGYPGVRPLLVRPNGRLFRLVLLHRRDRSRRRPRGLAIWGYRMAVPVRAVALAEA